MFAAVDGDPGHLQWLPQCQGSGAFCQNAITSHSAPHWIWSCPTSFDSGDSHEQAALKALLSTLELDGVDPGGCAAQLRPDFSARHRGGCRLAPDGQKEAESHQQIVSQFRGHWHVPVVISDCDASHSLQVRCTLRARNVTNSIREGWITQLASSGRRDGKPFHHVHCYLLPPADCVYITALRTSPKAHCGLCTRAGSTALQKPGGCENQWPWPRDIQLGEQRPNATATAMAFRS